MFENILFQKSVVSELLRDIQSAKLPQSLLLSGPGASGKSTLALELARVLSCEKQGAERGKWSCPCWSCKQQRDLSQPNVLLLGSANFRREIQVCRNFLDSSMQNGANLKTQKILLIVWVRSMRKLMKRFDAVLWEDCPNKSEKERKAHKALADFWELLEDISSCEFLQNETAPRELDKALIKKMDQSQSLSETLAAGVPQGIPIHQVRQLQRWSAATSDGVKIAILENIDEMNLSASNAMLKLLEEPPPSCYFLLSTRKRRAILPTILSRLRVFSLRARSSAEEQEIVARVFRSSGKETLQFLFEGGRDPQQDLAKESSLFLASNREGKPYFLVQKALEAADLELLLKSIASSLATELDQDLVDKTRASADLKAEVFTRHQHSFAWYQKYLRLSREVLERYQVYHEAPGPLLKYLYFELLEA